MNTTTARAAVISVAMLLGAGCGAADDVPVIAEPAPSRPGSTIESDEPTTAQVNDSDTDVQIDTDEWLDRFGDEMVAALGGEACAIEAAALIAAANEHDGISGPESLDELRPHLDRPIELWTLEPGDETPQPVPGSGCSAAGFQQPVDPDTQDDGLTAECLLQQRTLETAMLAWFDEHPDHADPPTEAELAQDYLREEIVFWDLDGWEIVRAPGSPCDHGASCGVVLRTVETAVEAFYAENEAWPASIDDLLGTYLRSDAPIDLVELGDGGSVRPAPGSVCSVD